MKFDAHVLRYIGIDLPDSWFDTMVAAWLLDEVEEHNLKMLWNKYCCKDPAEASDKFNKLFGSVTFNHVPPKLATKYGVKDTKMTYELMLFQKEQFDSNPNCAQLADIFWNLEMPVIPITYKAETKGMPIDVGYLRDVVSPQLHSKCDDLYDQILEVYVREGLHTPENEVAKVKEEKKLKEVFKKDGTSYSTKKFEGFNLNSNVQKQEFIWDMLKLEKPKTPGKKKDDGDRSLNTKKVLKKMRKLHPVIPLLMSYSTSNKLATAFADTLPEQARLCEDGVYRVYPSINTIGARTYRQSCKSPNLQQVPASAGEFIRNAFVAEKNMLLLSCDFSSQELRVLADVTMDEVLIDAFEHNKDLHSLTASNILAKQLEDYKNGLVQIARGVQDGIDTKKLISLFVAIENELLVISDIKIRANELSKLSQQELLNVINKRQESMGIYFTFGAKYELFETVRNKLTRCVETDEASKEEIITGVFPIEKTASRFSYLPEEQINILYTTANSLSNEDYLSLSHWFEKRRKMAKSVNFGTVYGISKYGLADMLDVTPDEAQSFIDGFLSGYPRIKPTMEMTNEDINKYKFIESKAGYKRRFYSEFEKIESDKSMKWLIGSCQRQGFNFKIQNVSAKMTKQAMIDLQPKLDEIGGYIVMTVHDELISMIPATTPKEKIKEIQEIMQNALPLCVPMKSDAEIGRKWGECKAVSEIADFLSLLAEIGEGGDSDEEEDEEFEDSGDATEDSNEPTGNSTDASISSSSYSSAVSVINAAIPNADTDNSCHNNIDSTQVYKSAEREVSNEQNIDNNNSNNSSAGTVRSTDLEKSPEVTEIYKSDVDVQCPKCGTWTNTHTAFKEDLQGMSIYECSECHHKFSEDETQYRDRNEVTWKQSIIRKIGNDKLSRCMKCGDISPLDCLGTSKFGPVCTFKCNKCGHLFDEKTGFFGNYAEVTHQFKTSVPITPDSKYYVGKKLYAIDASTKNFSTGEEVTITDIAPDGFLINDICVMPEYNLDNCFSETPLPLHVIHPDIKMDKYNVGQILYSKTSNAYLFGQSMRIIEKFRDRYTLEDGLKYTEEGLTYLFSETPLTEEQIVQAGLTDVLNILNEDLEDYKMGIEMLQKEVNTIKNTNVRQVITEILTAAPKYFWTIPASSTGKYHPKFALGEGGLVRHVKVGMMVMEELFRNNTIMDVFFPDGYSELLQDCIRGAYLIHDCAKSGLKDEAEKYTRLDHPLLVKELTTNISPETISKLTESERQVLSFMMNAVASHMGQWSTDRSGNDVLPKPQNGLEKFVHMIDYLASRRFLDVNLNDIH